MKFKKGSAAAKAFMAKLRAAKGKKKAAPKKKIGAVKKKAAKKHTVKKAATKKKAAVRNYGSHKDTGSHNVKIHVVSGTSQMATLHHLIKEKEKAEKTIPALKINLKKAGDAATKKHFKFWINRYTKYLSGLKKQINEAKKHI
jgi:hypothetical protein